MSKAAYINKHQDWENETITYWFDIDPTGSEWEAYSGRYAIVDCNGNYRVIDADGNDQAGGQFADYVLEVCEITDDIRAE